jgi:hypothetical protein
MKDTPSLAERMEQTRAAIDGRRESEARAFSPAETPEALILRVIGGWQNLLGEVTFTRFHAAGSDAGAFKGSSILKGQL